MNIKENPLYGIDRQGLFELLEISKEYLDAAVKCGFKHYQIEDNNGKQRWIDEPDEKLIALQKKLTDILQLIDCPEYCMCGWKGQNALKNVKAHIGNFSFVTADIANYYPNTKVKFVREFFTDKLKIQNDAADVLISITTYNGYIPTGAPTSTILAFLSHQNLFDEINKEMQERNITNTLYADDITLSAKHGITRNEIRYIQAVLGRHNLKLKSKKTKFYSYKKAIVTGYYIHQSGKITVPYWIGNTIKEKLKKTPLLQMNLYQVKSLLGYINYQRQIDKNAFKVLRIRAIKHLKKLMQS